jgi:hypothetical protein
LYKSAELLRLSRLTITRGPQDVSQKCTLGSWRLF